MPKIDAHQHFWKFDPVRDSWITGDMKAIRRDFYPADLAPVLQQYGIDGTVAVQASQTEEETHFLLELADVNPIVKGVVGWVDLRADNLDERLQYFKQFEKLKGFRHVLQSEPESDFMLQPAFKKGIATLEKFNYTYDILIYPEHLLYTVQLTTKFPNHRFVLDHIAKPHIKAKDIDVWEDDIKSLAARQNVHCKVSGLLTEADWKRAKPQDFIPYLDVVFNAFGIGRVMFGSDWPVCLVAGGYEKTMEVIQLYTSKLSAHEQELFWGGNAANFYNL